MPRTAPDSDLDDAELDSIADKAAREVGEKARSEERRAREDLPDNEIDVDAAVREHEERRDPETARERKANRYREARDRADAAERRAEAAERAANESKLRADALALMQQAPQNRTPEVDPYDTQLNDLWKEKKQIWDTWDALPDQARIAQKDQLQDRLRELDFKSQELFTQKALRQHMPVQQQVSRGDMILDTQFPEITAHPRGKAIVVANYNKLRALGRADTAQTLVEAAETAMRDLGMENKDRGRESLRAKMTSTSTASSPRGGASSSSAPARRTMDYSGRTKESEALREMARARFPDLPEHDAYKAHARLIGPRLKREA